MKRLLKVLNKETVLPYPIWFMRQAGRYLPEYRKVRHEGGNFLDLCYNSDLACEVTLQPIKRFDLDAAIVFSDILVIPDLMGVDVKFEPNFGPVINFELTENSIYDIKHNFDRDKAERLLKTIRHVRRDLPAEKTLIGFCGAPWTIASYMLEGGGSKGFNKAKKIMHEKRDLFNNLINLLTERIIEYSLMQVEAGAEVIQLFDSWSGVLSLSEFNSYSFKPIQHIINSIHKKTSVPIIVFCRNSSIEGIRCANSSGAAAVSIDYSFSLDDALDYTNVPLQGNLDPYMLAYDIDGALKQCDEICKTIGKRPFIFNVGHGIIPETNPDNVSRVIDRVRNFDFK